MNTHLLSKLLTADRILGVTVSTNIKDKKKRLIIHAEKEGKQMHIQVAELDLSTEKNGTV